MPSFGSASELIESSEQPKEQHTGIWQNRGTLEGAGGLRAPEFFSGEVCLGSFMF